MAFRLSEARLAAKTARGALFPADPPYLIFFVTHRCNARCGFCFDHKNRERAQPDKELGPEEIEKIADNWRGLVHVTLTGGEPFIRPDLAPVALAFIRSGVKSITIDTNGTMPGRTEDAVRAILSARPDIHLDLNISIDGPAGVHDRLRGLEGCLCKAMQTAQRLFPLHHAHPGFRLGATVTVSALNRETAENTVRELMEDGRFTRVQALLARGAPADPAALDPDPAAYMACCQALSKRRLSKGRARVREELSAMVRQKTAAAAKREGAKDVCPAGRFMVTVDPYGKVRPCEMLDQLRPGGGPLKAEDPWVMGSLRECGYSMEKVLATGDSKKIRQWIRQSGCRCTFECAAYAGIVFRPRRWPALLARLFIHGP